MKKRNLLYSVIVIFIFILGIASFTSSNFQDKVVLEASTVKDEREFKAVWVTPLVGDVSLNGESTFKTNMNETLDIMEYYGLNALIFHVRTHNNALYPSNYNPKATYVSNINFNNFDPIEWLIAETHRRGIEFHAWMNPYRYNTSYQTGSMPAANPQANSGNTIEGSILNPALSNVKQHIYNTIDEFINLYPTVDAIHFDDYFYVSTTAAPTGANARRAHIDELINGIHDLLTTFNTNNNRHVQFGISPTGIYKNGNGVVTYDSNGLPITTGSNTRGQAHYGDYLYADTLKWITEGWLDYILPQVYWARDLSAAPFNNVLSWWDQVVRYLDVNLYTGIGLYKSLETGGAGWYTNSSEMNAQYNIIENNLNNVLGYAIFSFKQLKMAYNGDTTRVGQQVNNAYNTAARKAVRVLPELKSMTPITPAAVHSSHSSGSITWNSVSNAKFYYIYESSGELTYSSDEIIGVIGHQPGQMSYTIDNYKSNYNYGIRALSPTNHLSPIATGTPPEPIEVYDITYHLNGGSFEATVYENRNEMIEDFLTDFYNFVNPAVNLNTFMHGSGKTSGFDGLYDGDYFSSLFNINNKSVDASTGKFINQPEYNKWVPLLDLIDEYTNKGYPPQTFWGSSYVAQRRIKPFFRQINLWEEDGEPKASIIMEILNRIPSFADNPLDSIYYQYTKNFPDIILPNAVRSGYRFLGWYTANEGGSRVTSIPAGSTGNKIFYARWEEISPEVEEVLVTFNLDYDGRYLTPQTIEKGGYALKPANPTREHYTFLGWYLNGNLFNFSTAINSNTNLVARWSFSSYYVKFYDYDATLLKEEIVAPGANATAPNNPSRVGYIFTGWDKSFRNINSDINVYAEYSVSKYIVEFVDSDGSTINTVLVEHGSLVSSISPPYNQGLTFVGWYLNNELFDFNTPITEDIVLVAWWDTIRYTVTFLNEDGSVYTTQSVAEGAKATRPAINPINEGFTFNAWKLNDNVYNFNLNVNGNLTLTPSWDILIHTISFLDYDLTLISSVSVEHGSKAARPVAPLRYGYTFRTWNIGDIEYNFNWSVYENATLVAQWDINMYTVKFLDYDGTVLSTQTIAHGSGAIAPVNPNNKPGHSFFGWDKSFNNIVNYTEINAVYSAYNVFVNYVDEDGAHINSVIIPYGESVPKPTDPYKVGYVFVGWLHNDILYDFSTLIYADITLVASWELGGHDVTFLNYDGSVFIVQSVNDGAYATKPTNNPLRDGYKFINWQLNGSDFNFETKIYTDITLSPTWDVLVHTVSFLDHNNNLFLSVDVIHGQRVTKPSNNPTRVGYTFKVWNIGEIEYNFNWAVYEDVSLISTWTQNVYTVRFLDYDGTVLKVVDVAHGGSVIAPSSPNNQVGHYFLKWDKTFSNITESFDVTAIYVPFNYYVYFEDDDGSTFDTSLIPYGTKAVPPSNPHRSGHTFKGWTLEGEIFDFDEPIYTDITLVASWEINLYKITFYDRGNVVLEYSLEYGSKIPIPEEEPTRSGYSFAGWLNKGFLYDFDEVVWTDVSLTAGWTAVGYNVTFKDAEGGIFMVVNVEANTTVVRPVETPLKEGYVFDSWLLNGIIYSFSLPVNANITLEPSYNVLMHTVNFLDNDFSLISTVKVEHGKQVTKPSNPTKAGYTFKGWYLADIEYNFNHAIYESTNILARWNINTYVVRFFDGSTLLKREDVVYQGNATPPSVAIKEGYTFIGWDNNYANITKDIDVFAVYRVSTYTVVFKDYEKTISTLTVEHGKNATAPIDPKRVGYTFVGWDKTFNSVTTDLVVNAVYEIITLTVKYYDYYDNILKVETVNYGALITPPVMSIVEGAEFTGWLLEATTPYSVDEPVTENLELYASYDVFSYSVRFLDYDGTVLKLEEVLHGNPATPPTTPIRSGYSFAGWDKDYSVIKSNLDIAARYVKEDTKTYEVKFSDEFGNVISTLLVSEGESVNRPNNPTKEGYIFKGWYLNNDLFDFNTAINSDLTITANFEIKTYQVVYKDDKGIVRILNPVYDTTISVPVVPNRVGYIGVWEINLENIKIRKDYEINAIYTLINYQITYNNTKDAINNNPSTHTLLEVVVLEDLISLDEENGFLGWYDESDNQVLVLSGIGDKVIYAKWEVKEHKVVFVDEAGVVLSTQYIEHGKSAVAPTAPVKAHYNHVGWDKDFSNVRNDLVVKAIYVGVVYSLSFSSNGQIINKKDYQYPNLPLRPIDPIRVGYGFAGWYVSDSFGEEYLFIKPLTKDTTIYANWQINTYVVTFVDDVGHVIIQKNVKHGDDVVAPTNVIKAHHKQVGWDRPLENITQNITIKALFEANTYRVTFNSLGGSSIEPVSYIYPSKPEEPKVPEKEGYDFVGWYLDSNYKTRFNFNETLTSDVSVYARWLEKLDDNKYISMYQQAAIRYKTESSSQGLRFYARLHEDVKKNEHGFYLVYGDTSVEQLRIAINNQNGDKLIINGKEVYKVEVDGVDIDNSFNVVLTGIPEKGYIDKLSVIGYVNVDGEEYYSLEPVSRSVAEVAFKNLNSGEVHNALTEIVNNIEKKIVYRVNSVGDIELNNTFYEFNHFSLLEEFNYDFNELLNKEFSGLTTLESDLKSFYEDEYLKDKWLFMLDYFLSLSSNSNLNNQIRNIKESKQNSTIKELVYAFANFFNEENNLVGGEVIDFTNLSNYLTLKKYNNKIYINPHNYDLYKIGDELVLPEVENDKIGFEFEHYLVNGVKYKALSSYIVADESVSFAKVFNKTTYLVTFMLDNSIYYETEVEPFGSLDSLPSVYKARHMFLGWYTNEDELYNINDEITENLVLTAKFEAINYLENITINIDKETYEVISNSSNIAVTVSFDYNYVIVEVEPVDNYQFSHNVNVSIYFSGEASEVVSFEVKHTSLRYVLSDPNYSEIF